jgi:hypothetical protein
LHESRESFLRLVQSARKSKGAEHVEQFIFCSSNNHFFAEFVGGNSCFAKTIFTPNPDAYVSATQSYEASVLKLALDKTITEYGPYEPRAAPQNNVTRVFKVLEPMHFPIILKASVTTKNTMNLKKSTTLASLWTLAC